jgi:hypothetical protein
MTRYFILLQLAALPASGKDLPEAPTPAGDRSYNAASSSHVAGASQTASESWTHKFFDRGKIRKGGLAGVVAGDGISAQQITCRSGHWREANPLARPAGRCALDDEARAVARILPRYRRVPFRPQQQRANPASRRSYYKLKRGEN